VGGITPEAAELARALYATFCDGEIILTDAKTAELAKLVENSYRDVNIAFANELSVVADALDVDVWELISLANHHPRVNILQPGPGVGGHCIAVDPWFIVDAAPAHTPLIRTAREVNDAKPEWVREKVRASVAGREGLTIATLGLAFKPDIDDLRESPARQIVADLADEHSGCRILVVEPHIEALPQELANRRNVELTTLEDAGAAADVVVLLVDHRPFRASDPVALGISGKPIIDTRGVWL
jgi:UDP-N-acetyl-D-mannosaminuronic acid dehydrogenase